MTSQAPIRRAAAWRVVLMFLAAVAGTLLPATAHAANVVNVTIHVPATVLTNTCTPVPDEVAVTGDIHIVISLTADTHGGYHTDESINSQFSGQSLVTGIGYQAADTTENSFYAGAPFPVINTVLDYSRMLSQTATANFLLSFQLHTTVNATGTPTATVDHVRVACTGPS
jgi:hypothetical protein